MFLNVSRRIFEIHYCYIEAFLLSMIYYCKLVTIEKMNTSLIKKNWAIDDRNVNTIAYNDDYFILKRQWICVRLNDDIQVFDVYDWFFFCSFSAFDFQTQNTEYENDVESTIHDILSTACSSSKILFINVLFLTFNE